MDELTAPLGLDRPPPRRLPIARIFAVGFAVLLLAGGALWFAAHKGLLRGKSIAAAPAPPPAQVLAPGPTPPAASEATGSILASPEPGRRTVTIIDGMSGKRQEVPIGAAEPAPAIAPNPRPR